MDDQQAAEAFLARLIDIDERLTAEELRGRDGVDGRSAFEIAQAGGFKGSVSEWLVFLRGEAGQTGPQGAAGVDGRDGAPGDPGPRGERGFTGFEGLRGLQGFTGPMPRHEWRGSELRFEQSPGEWGDWVDLRGPRGHSGYGGGGFSITDLPVADRSLPDQIVVRQGGTWARMTLAAFLALIGGTPASGSSYADDYADGYS